VDFVSFRFERRGSERTTGTGVGGFSGEGWTPNMDVRTIGSLFF
jgi:hypothetical protein